MMREGEIQGEKCHIICVMIFCIVICRFDLHNYIVSIGIIKPQQFYCSIVCTSTYIGVILSSVILFVKPLATHINMYM